MPARKMTLVTPYPFEIDNGPVLNKNADSTLNERLVKGKYSKRMKINREDSPSQDYMKSLIDLTHPGNSHRIKLNMSPS